MRTILRAALVSCLPVIAGCIAVLPFGEFVPATTDGKVYTNCVGSKRVSYRFDGVSMGVSLNGSGSEDPPSRLNIWLTPSEGRVARISTPEIRVRPIGEGPEKIHPLPTWERSALRAMKPGSKMLQRVTVETAPAAGPIVGGRLDDSEDVYKLHTVAPIEYRHQYRLEFMVPLNC